MIRINLAPAETRRRSAGGGFSFTMPAFNLGLLFAVVYAVAAAAVGVSWWALHSDAATLAAAIERGTRENAQLKATLGAGATVKPQLVEMRRRVQVIESLVKNQGSTIALLDAFADTLPNDLWITALEDKSSVLKLRGTAYSTTAVADFMSNLKRSGRFKDVEIVVSTQDLAKPPSVVTFEVTCRFEG